MPVLTLRQDISPFYHGIVKLIEQHRHQQSGGPKMFEMLTYAPILKADGNRNIVLMNFI